MNKVILLMDSSLEVLMALHRFFLETPCDIICTRSGASALYLMNQVPVTLAIIDADVPDMPFSVLLHECRNVIPRPVIMGIEGARDAGEFVTLQWSDVVCMLPKPLDLSQLQDRIEACGIPVHRSGQLRVYHE